MNSSVTASGKPRSMVVSLRLPVPVWEQANARAVNRGKRMSEILRDAVIRGLQVEQPLAHKRRQGYD